MDSSSSDDTYYTLFDFSTITINHDVSVIWYISTYIWCGIFWILLTILVILSIYQFILPRANQPIPLFRYFTTTVVFLCWTCSGFDLAHITSHMIEAGDSKDTIENDLEGSSDMSYFLSTITFYSLLITKVWFVFRGTIYEIVPCTILFYILLLFILLFGAIMHCYYDRSFRVTGDSDDFSGKEVPVTYILSITDFLLNLSLFTLFWYKIRETILCIDVPSSFIIDPSGLSVNNNDTATDVDTSRSINLSGARAAAASFSAYDPSLKLFEVMSKHSVLFGIALITNQMFYVGLLMEDLFQFEDNNYTAAILVLFCARALENFVNALVPWLMMSVNYYFYFKLCSCCHRYVQKLCKYVTRRTTSRSNSKRTSYYKNNNSKRMKTVDEIIYPEYIEYNDDNIKDLDIDLNINIDDKEEDHSTSSETTEEEVNEESLSESGS